MLPESFRPTRINLNAHEHQRITLNNNSQTNGVNSISEYFAIIEQYAQGISWYFRGESERYVTTGLPAFARDYYDTNGILKESIYNELELLKEPERTADNFFSYPSLITKQEIEIIQNFQKNPPNDQIFSALVGDNSECLGWLSFAQHYGEKTRLLDVTRDPLVALYFACQKGAGDGYVWLYPNPVSIECSYSPPSYKEAFDVGIGIDPKNNLETAKRSGKPLITRQERPPLDCSFLLRLEETNERIIAQRGAFMWSPKVLSPMTHNSFCIHIAMKSKENILSKLSAYGIHNAGLKLESS